MDRIKKLFNTFILSFVLVGALVCGLSLCNFSKKENSPKEVEVSADANYDSIVNNLPQYFNPQVSNGTAGDNGNSLFLLSNTGKISVDLTNGTALGQEKDELGSDNQPTGNKYFEENYAYYPDKTNNPDTFYYFNFYNTLSLFYDLTNDEVESINATDPRNLLRSTSLSNYVETHEKAFNISTYAFTPQNFKLDFSLNTSLSNIQTYVEGAERNPSSKHEIVLNKEGCYTLVVPYTYYYTENGGRSFTDHTSSINFSFLIFKGATYLDANNLPNVTVSQFARSSTLINNQSHSKYYFYNYTSTILSNGKAQLPSYTYNPHHYQLTINYVDINDEASTYVFKLKQNEDGSEKLVATNLSGDEVESPIMYELSGENAILSFNELGSYDISFEFIYQAEGSGKVFTLPMTAKRQRFYIFGYQASYTSQEKDPETNQTISKELKQVNLDRTFERSADVTSLAGFNAGQASSTAPAAKNILNSVEASLAGLPEGYPISTNQTPVKFTKNGNVTLRGESRIFRKQSDGTWSEDPYSGENLQAAGTYVVIPIYQYSDFLSINGTQQSSFYHYQIFYFTITDTTPTVDVTTLKGDKLYSGDYTNQSVFIVDNASLSDYDAKVEIKLTAQDYKKDLPFFKDENNNEIQVNIKDFVDGAYPGITYYDNLGKINSAYEGKAGVYIDATDDIASPYHNALFTIYIKSANAINPSLRTFTIDTNPIGDIYATKTSYRTSSDYNLIERLTEGNKKSNQPLAFSWDEKASKAQTYGYFKFYELKQTQYYNNSANATDYNHILLTSVLEEDKIVPINYTLDLSVSDPGWTNYANTIDYKNSSRIPSAYVRSSAGLYIFEVYDAAGNCTFDVFLIDNTSPMFIKRITATNRSYTLSVLSTSDTVTVSDDYKLKIEWGSQKGIYIKGINAPNYTIPQSLYSKYENDNIDEGGEMLKQVVDKFFDNNSKLLDNIPSLDKPSDLPSYNGRYLLVNIVDTALIKEVPDLGEVASDYKAFPKTSSYEINFFKSNGEAREGDYKFLLRDESNTIGTNTEEDFKSNPSAYLTINISSDSSRLEFWIDQNKVSSSGYDQTGSFYLDNDKNLVKNDTGNLDTSGLSYKYAYYNPVKTTKPLYLSYIPYSYNESRIQSLTLTYYEYEKKAIEVEMRDHNNNAYMATTYHYTLKNTPSRTIDIFELTDENVGNIEKDDGNGSTAKRYQISFGGTDDSAPAGKYVITRRYTSNGSIDKYDYFERNLTLIVDRYGVISAQETVSKTLPDGSVVNALESIVGGDIALSMYAGEGNSNISLSFPNYNTNTGLNQGSFYTSTNIGEDETPVAVIESNKVPLAVKIPSSKYTLYNEYNYADNDYSVAINDKNSYFGNFDYVESTNLATGRVSFKVYTELAYKLKDGNVVTDESGKPVIDEEKSLLLQTCTTKQEAENYMAACKARASIAEYKLYATIQYMVGNQTLAWYRTNGETLKWTHGDSVEETNYLNFYKAPAKTGAFTADDTTLTQNFTAPGRYIVTIYQASNQSAATEGDAAFNSFYKFTFEIASASPDFKVLATEDGTELNSIKNQNGEIYYYTNTPYVTLSWTDSDSEYMAKIDQDKIKARPYYKDGYTGQWHEIDKTLTSIEKEGNSYTYDIFLGEGEGGYNIWENDNRLAISMQYEGFDDNTAVVKYIYVDYTAPYENLAKLENKTASSTYYLTRLFQEKNMRSLETITESKNTSSWTDASLIDEYMKDVSYSYSAGSGDFRYFTYSVDRSYFNDIYNAITATATAGTNYITTEQAKSTRELLFRSISTSDGEDLFADYVQTTKGFSKYGNGYMNLVDYYDNLSSVLVSNHYYEVIELDTAGNMVVYIVYINDNLDDHEALVYTNEKLQQSAATADKTKSIANSTLQEDFNIYSTSGFKLDTLDYNADVWGFYATSVNGVVNYYMKSPRLMKTGKINRITFTAGNPGYRVSQVNLSEIFDDVDPSSTKHNITLSDRLTGKQKIIYLSIQDASLETVKYSDATSATLGIYVNDYEHITSKTQVEIFPVKIEISSWSAIKADWDTLLSEEVPSGNPTEWSQFTSSSIGFDYQMGRLLITLNIQANSSQKFRYVITDNFGTKQTIIQMANEKTFDEIVHSGAVYENVESDTFKTYLSASDLTFQYNSLIYNAAVTRVFNNGVDVTDTETVRPVIRDGIGAITLRATEGNYDKVYVIEVNELEQGEFIKNVYLRVFNKLPILTDGGDVADQNNIWFLDKEAKILDKFDNIPSLSIRFKGNLVTTSATSITTFSNNVTVRFNDGQTDNSPTPPEEFEDYSFFDPYHYSVYLSEDGQNWTNVNDSYSLGYTFSGVGSYYVYVCYDSEDAFVGLNRLFMVNILNSSTVSYYFNVDGLPVSPRPNFKYTTPDGEEISTVYMLNIPPRDKDSRVSIEGNEELETTGLDNPRQIDDKDAARAGAEVYVYEYSSTITSRAKFAVIYIGESTSILNPLYYEDPTSGGSNRDLLQIENPANPDHIVSTTTSFNRLKISWNTSYAIKENKVNVKVYKLFNNDYVEVNVNVYGDDDLSYIYLTRAGTYRLRFEDSCVEPNVHKFGRSDYINIVFLNGVPFTLTYTDPVTQEERTSEPINRAVYNGTVKLSLSNPSSYFTSGYEIEVMKDGKEYKGYTNEGANNFIFSENGFYSISFNNVVSINQQNVRKETVSFSIINENESRFAFEYSTYANYYIKSIFKNGIDMTERYLNIIDTDKTMVDKFDKNGNKIGQQEYLTSLGISFFDMKTGSGRYVVTIETGEQTYKNTTATSFSFAFRINMAYPPLTVNLDEGGTTSNPINVSFNIRNLYESVGDCVVRIPGRPALIVNADMLASEGEIYSTDVTAIGTNYVQVYTMSGNLLYSYKITRTEPLNVWAIIAIVISVIVVGVIIFITIKLRKRLKVK